MKKPPHLLLLGCILYLLLEVVSLALDPSTTIAVRFSITLVLFFFVLRGSRTAGVIWGICNLLGALMAGYFAIKLAGSSPTFGIFFAVTAIVTAANAGYLFFNKRVRAFQEQGTALGT